MKRNITVWEGSGFITTSILGTLLHFLYDWTSSTVAALFSGVNESTWEHMKLLFFPMFFFALAQSFFMEKDHKNFWCIKLVGTLIGLVLIPVLFYTVRGAFGATPNWINITIFFVATAAAYAIEATLFRQGNLPCQSPLAAFAGLCLIAVAFWAFTFAPPALPLFRDPLNGSYGLS